MAELIRLTGIKSGVLSRIGNNKQEPGAEILAKIALNTDINIHWLVTGQGAMIPFSEGEVLEIAADNQGTYRTTRNAVSLKTVRPLDESHADADLREMIEYALDILQSNDKKTRDALKSNLIAFKESLEKDRRAEEREKEYERRSLEKKRRIEALERDVDALKKVLNPADPPAGVKEG